jgi:hypothetical protein
MRKLRVYAKDGGFTLEIPDEARVTFGYFNPASSGKSWAGYGPGPGSDTARTTALRIYKKTGAKTEDQIACFLGVNGFRDLSIEYEKHHLNDPL